MSGIQSQLFAIPISITIFISQIKYDATTKYITLINLSIFLAATMVFIISLVMLNIQKKTLQAIYDELNQKKKRFEFSIPESYKTLEPTFTQLAQSYERNKLIICMIKFFSTISFIIVLLLCSWFTPRTHCIVVNKLPDFLQRNINHTDLKLCSPQTDINTINSVNKIPKHDDVESKHQAKAR